MTKGYVASFDARRGRGFLKQSSKADPIPFRVQNTETTPAKGDAVEFAVTGGKAGLMAKNVRPLPKK